MNKLFVHQFLTADRAGISLSAAVMLAVLSVMLLSCSPRPFTFVQMTDPQIGFRDNTPGFVKSDSLFNKAVEAVNILNPKCVIITGDLINDAYDALQDSIYRANLAKIKVPVYEVPGNHDIRPWNPENHSHYLHQRGYERFSFRLGGCAFIGFDSNCIKDGTEKLLESQASESQASESQASESQASDTKPSVSATLSKTFAATADSDGKVATMAEKAAWVEAMAAEEAQYKWLEDELWKARGCKYIFVFLHCPVIRESIDEENDYFNFHKGSGIQSVADSTESQPLVDGAGSKNIGSGTKSGKFGDKYVGARERYIALFKKYGVDVVFAGHTHMDYDTTAEGIRFVTAGPVGMPLGRGYSGYEVVTVRKDGIDCRFTPTIK